MSQLVRRRGTAALFVALVPLVALVAPQLAAQNAAATAGNEVRQIVTFLFQPGKTNDALTIYRDQLVPIYTGDAAMKRFRGYRETESPEPLDLVVISSFDGMAGMDTSNEALRRATAGGQSAFGWYGTLSGMTLLHHDQFVEMLPALSDTATTGADLTVFEYIRLAPMAHTRFTTHLALSIRPFERTRGLYAFSETGRLLVSDGWDFVRIHGIRSLADWQRALTLRRSAPGGEQMETMIAARKVIILRRDPKLSVR